MDDGRRAYHGRDAEGKHGDAKALLCKPASVVPDAGAGVDPRVGKLDGDAEPVHRPGSQRVDGEDSVRPCLLDDAAQDFRRLHAGLCHDAGDNPGKHGKALFLRKTLSVFGIEMARHRKMLQYPRPQGIRRRLRVPKPHHQHRRLFLIKSEAAAGKQKPDLSCQLL